MTKMQYILLTAIMGFYGLLLVTLLCRAFVGLWRAERQAVNPGIEKKAISVVSARARNHAWTRAVRRGPLARDAQLGS